MRNLLAALATILIGVALLITDAEAQRLGAAQASAPAQQAPAATQPQTSQVPQVPRERWLPTLGSLALGGLLGSLFGGSGFGGAFVLVLLTFGAIVFFWLRDRGRGQPLPPLHHGMLGVESGTAASPSQAADIGAPAMPAPKVPSGFDVAGFVRTAKVNFVKLQIANEIGDLAQIRAFTTPQMLDALGRNLTARGVAAQRGGVLTLEPQLLGVATEGDTYVARVRFSGTTREAADGASSAFAEVWNLTKPVDGSSGWLLAGIQQAA